MNLDDAFATLRSLLNARTWTTTNRRTLWELIDEVSTHHPRVYLEQWLPYIEGFPHHFIEPLVGFDDLDELIQTAQRAPGIPLSLYTRGATADDALLRRIAATPESAQIASLELVGRYSRDPYLRSVSLSLDALEELFESPHLTNLVNLKLRGAGITDAGCDLIASSPQLAGLKRLDLSLNEVGLAGSRALSSSEHLTELTRLLLAENPYIDPVSSWLRMYSDPSQAATRAMFWMVLSGSLAHSFAHVFEDGGFWAHHEAMTEMPELVEQLSGRTVGHWDARPWYALIAFIVHEEPGLRWLHEDGAGRGDLSCSVTQEWLTISSGAPPALEHLRQKLYGLLIDHGALKRALRRARDAGFLCGA